MSHSDFSCTRPATERTSAAEFAMMLAKLLAGSVRGKTRWLELIGRVDFLLIALGVGSNWSVNSVATGEE